MAEALGFAQLTVAGRDEGGVARLTVAAREDGGVDEAADSHN